jgi:hypothetical protein
MRGIPELLENESYKFAKVKISDFVIESINLFLYTFYSVTVS